MLKDEADRIKLRLKLSLSKCIYLQEKFCLLKLCEDSLNLSLFKAIIFAVSAKLNINYTKVISFIQRFYFPVQKSLFCKNRQCTMTTFSIHV